jgi:hypothetical protein
MFWALALLINGALKRNYKQPNKIIAVAKKPGFVEPPGLYL